ncbi:MAG: rhomboid family intramembrane serine protease [Paenibacillaceae bacterium]
MSLFVRRESFRQYLSKFPITSLILAINAVYFGLLHLFPGTSQGDTIRKWGAYAYSAIQDGEYYRFVTPIFMQIGISHFIFNVFSIFMFVSVLEHLIGRFRFILIYMGAGIVGYVTTYLFSSSGLGLGASGAIFGVLGAFLYLSQKKSGLLDNDSRKTIIPILILNLLYTFIDPQISITGHLGGLVGGYMLSMLLRIEKHRA